MKEIEAVLDLQVYSECPWYEECFVNRENEANMEAGKTENMSEKEKK